MAQEHTMPLHNTCEIGRLRTVMLHRPGRELENLMPEYLERLLFDDIPSTGKFNGSIFLKSICFKNSLSNSLL